MINLRRLRYFVVVAEELHFSRAAERLGIAQPPLSQQIQKLEAELDALLFDRSSRMVRLTDAGHALLPEARRLLSMSEKVAETARAVEAGHAGRLRIGLTGSVAFRLVPILLRRYRSAFPNVVIDLIELPTVDQIARVTAGEVDIGVVRSPILNTDVRKATVWSEPLVVALPQEHRLAEAEPIEPADLAEEDFVIFPRQRGPGLYELVIGMCEEAGFSPRIVQEAIQMQTIVGLVAAGFGISVVPSSVQDFRLHGVVYRRLTEPSPRSNVELIWNGDLHSAIRDRFLDLALNQHYGESRLTNRGQGPDSRSTGRCRDGNHRGR